MPDPDDKSNARKVSFTDAALKYPGVDAGAEKPQPCQPCEDAAPETSGASLEEDYATAEGLLDEALDIVGRGGLIRLEPFERLSGSFTERLLDGENLALAAYNKKTADYDVVSHSLNVGILSLQVGKRHKLPRQDLQELCTSALLHDLGMVKVPRDIFLKPGSLSTTERELLQKHPAVAYEAILGAHDATASEKGMAEVAYSVHERCTGRGYPRRLSADEIPERAKLLGLIDMYEALTHNRPFRKRLPPLDAIKEIIATGRDCFPTDALKALIDQLTTYPVGCSLRLNSGEICRVVATNPFSPLRPVVEVIFSGSGKRLAEPRTLDLSRSPLQFIVDTVFEEDLPSPGV
ncbi:MAG: HD domain-containing protein [Nitrospirae bacterium]|nr:HD domain-containing protein [Nitrospirota bacterium]